MNAQPSLPDRPRLLFVDDESRILVSLKSIFRNDYDVRIANSGAEAIDILRGWPADVLVSDQRMPEMTGVDVLRSAAEIRPTTTRILLTGYSDLEAIIGSVNDGEIFRFVSKPWRRNELRDTVAAAVKATARALTANDEPDTPAVPEPVSSVSVADQPGVLILDADAAEREALRHVLSADRPVHVASSFLDALEQIRTHQIGMVITESSIGGEPVTTLINGLHSLRPGLVYIVLTGQPDAQHIIDLINFGRVYRVLRKPINVSVLRGTVNLAARRHQSLARRPERARELTEEVAPMPPERQNRGLFAKIREFLHA
ncbi:response regulator [uncultured Abyssibacter sp.]|uniref:response regulator n=1 Tax=uncultured Abyssibacter sp. TaxID=2320202 RepID=UPI0032B10A26